jgi:hypothetical protein
MCYILHGSLKKIQESFLLLIVFSHLCYIQIDATCNLKHNFLW